MVLRTPAAKGSRCSTPLTTEGSKGMLTEDDVEIHALARRVGLVKVGDRGHIGQGQDDQQVFGWKAAREPS
jgi:hypothetical protein